MLLRPCILQYNITSAGAVDREFVNIYIWPNGVPMSPNWVQIGSRLDQIESQLGSTWIPLDPTGPSGAPLGARPGLGTSRALKSAAGAQDLRFWNSSPQRWKWCQEGRLGAHLPHAPGARMTVVQQTPSNELPFV